MDGNVAFTQDKGRISKICKEYKLYYPFEHHHSDQRNAKSYINGKHKYIFFLQIQLTTSYNIIRNDGV